MRRVPAIGACWQPSDECATSPAAEYPLFYWVIGTWFGTVLLVWVAYTRLVVKKYADLIQMEDDSQVRKKKERRTIEDARLDRAYMQLWRVKSLFAYRPPCPASPLHAYSQPLHISGECTAVRISGAESRKALESTNTFFCAPIE